MAREVALASFGAIKAFRTEGDLRDAASTRLPVLKSSTAGSRHGIVGPEKVVSEPKE